jgi:hypothetical protein
MQPQPHSEYVVEQYGKSGFTVFADVTAAIIERIEAISGVLDVWEFRTEPRFSVDIDPRYYIEDVIAAVEAILAPDTSAFDDAIDTLNMDDL